MQSVKTCLAFDLGASSGRAVLGRFSSEKCLSVEEVHRFKNYPYEKDGHWFWNFEGLLHEIKTGIQKAYQIEHDILSLSIDTWGVDYVFFRNGKRIRDPFNYRDMRTDEIIKSLPISEQEIYAESGIQFLPFNTVFQLMAHKKQYPGDFENSVCLLMPDALIYELTGVCSSEYTNSSTTGMLNPSLKSWNTGFLRKMGIPDSILPEIVKPCSFAGVLSPSVCRELGVPALPVVKAGSHDTASAVAAVPVSADSKNRAYISSGTWSLLGMELDRPNVTEQARTLKYTNEGGLNGKIRFLTNIIGSWLLQETKRVWNEAGEDISFADMEAMASAAPRRYIINPNDAVFLPPGDMPERIRKYCRESGQGDPASKAEIVRCIYDSLVECYAAKLKDLETLHGIPIDVLHILGGGTRDNLLMQLTANAIRRPVVAGPVEATAIGNLLAQFMTIGQISDLAEARSVVRGSFEVKSYFPE